jgi:hypothetical protein
VAAHIADAANSLLMDDILAGMDPVVALELWLAEEEPCASVDWNEPMALNAETGDYDLFADTGANVHISPC